MKFCMKFCKKFCNDCKKTKSSDEFGTRYGKRKKTLVLRAFCRACMNKRMVAWRNKNIARYRAYQNIYQAARRQRLRTDNPN